MLLAVSSLAQAQTFGKINTVVGTGESPSLHEAPDNNVLAQHARLYYPKGMAVGARGGIFFADGNLIRKYNPRTNLLTTLAGAVEAGFAGDGGPAEDARFFNPTDIEADAQGNLYIADNGNYRVRKIAFDGTITTIVGTGVQGFAGDDGPATQAQLTDPTGLALDRDGNLYIADGHRVRKVDAATQVITTISGTPVMPSEPFFEFGPALETPIGRIWDLVVDRSGNLYLTAYELNQIFLLVGDQIQWIAGEASGGDLGDGKDATSVNFAFLHGIDVNARGDLFISDTYHHRIRRLDSVEGTVQTIAGTGPTEWDSGTFGGDDNSALTARLNAPWDAVLHPEGGLYIADTQNLRIRRVESTSGGALFNGGPFPREGMEYGANIVLDRPENDDIQAALPLFGSSGQLTGTNVGATPQFPFLAEADGEPSHGYYPPQRSIWYRWNPEFEGRATLDTLGSDFDTRISVYKSVNGLPSLERVASNNDLSGNIPASKVSFAVEGDPTVTYYIAVDGHESAVGTANLQWNLSGLFAAAPRGPRITGITPPLLSAGQNEATVQVLGENFFGSPSVLVNGAARPTRKISDTALEVTLPALEISLPGTLWFRVDIDLNTISNIFGLDVYQYSVYTAEANGLAGGGSADSPRNIPRVLVTAQCGPEAGCTAVPAVGSLGLAANWLQLPGQAVSDSLFISSVTNAVQAGTQLRTGVGLNAGSRIVAYTGAPTLTLDGITLPSLGGGTLNRDSAVPGGPLGPSPAGEWRLVQGSDGSFPVIQNILNADGSLVGQVSMAFDAASTPSVAELNSTVFAIVDLVVNGDVNVNGQIEVEDAVRVIRAAAGLETLSNLQLVIGDVAPAPGVGPNEGQPFGDGLVDVQDAVRILRTAIGLP